MNDFNISPEGAVHLLAEKLLGAQGKIMITKGHDNAATKQEIIAAYKEATDLVNSVVRGR